MIFKTDRKGRPDYHPKSKIPEERSLNSYSQIEEHQTGNQENPGFRGKVRIKSMETFAESLFSEFPSAVCAILCRPLNVEPFLDSGDQ